MASLRRVLLLIRDVPAATKFYTEGLGLQTVFASDTFTELQARPGAGSGGPTICLSEAESEAHVTTGYSPHLHFDIADMDTTVVQLLQLGARLDGAIKYEPHGKVAAVRAPDGHMLGLYEPVAGEA